MTEQLEWPAEPPASTFQSRDRLEFKQANGYDVDEYNREVYGDAGKLCWIADLAERDGKTEGFDSYAGIHVSYGNLAIASETLVWKANPAYIDRLIERLSKEGETRSFIYRYLSKMQAERQKIKDAKASQSRNAESD